MIDNGCGTIENFVNVFSFKDVSNIEYYLFSKTVSKGIENWLNAIANGGSVSDVYYDTYVKTAFDVIYSSTDLVVPFLSEDVVSFIEESFQKYGYGNTWSSLGEVCSLFTLDQFFTNWWEGVKLIFGN